MRILLVNKFIFPKGGAETYTFDVGKMLEEHGHEVQYFGLANEKNTVGNRVDSYVSDMDFSTLINICITILMIITTYITAPMLIKFTPTSLLTWFVYAICVAIYSLFFICIFHIIFERENFKTILLRLKNMRGK